MEVEEEKRMKYRASSKERITKVLGSSLFIHPNFSMNGLASDFGG
jgi:hypothetical protein